MSTRIPAQKLSPEDVEFYRRNGYFLYHQPVFSPDKLARLTTIFEEHLADKGSKLSDELDTPHFRDPRLLEFLLSDEVLDIVEPVLGPNIALWSSHFICKDPYVGRATPWHEDSAYWNGRFDGWNYITTVWLALDRSTHENGCMRVIPGTHINGFSEYEDVDMRANTFHRQIKNAIDTSRAVDFELERGECSLHDARIVHGAEPNTSPYRRCGYTMRYISTNLRVIPEKNRNWRMWLARGQDLAGNHYENA
jgi:ectoine hydroxylase-related dioxygenase (phytanoyl-CoA dioxygenase family)